ncbi:MAG: dynamin family protein [Rhodoferax sp.]|nr:dynamin family protein [Rhodoferax sp.]
MAGILSEQFDQHGAWRREFSLRLKLLGEWLTTHGLIDAELQERLARLETQVRSDKVMVAFVAEFSRGKSEMINALFFANYGRRIMPANVGRTTMCPTEMGYDAGSPSCLRLLPIETRLSPLALADWRNAQEQWVRMELDVTNPRQMASVFEKVVETSRVSEAQARAMGFWNTDLPDDRPEVDAQGMVEIPRWRHALVNLPHPLLKQGLVILDTPGLNAIGAEPELTVSLIPQAQAVVFLLGADTGVTRSDLSIWREYLHTESVDSEDRLVVLNKIDTLWDVLSSPAQIQGQIDRQRLSTAAILGIAKERVIAVSAQKGLVAKVTNDALLLAQSRLQVLEHALGQRMLDKRQAILAASIGAGIKRLRAQTGRVIHIRQRELTEQMLELQSLQGKNANVIKHMRARVAKEKAEFDAGGAKIQAVRAVQGRLLREVLQHLQAGTVKKEVGILGIALAHKGLKLGAKRPYRETFDRLRGTLQRVQVACDEIHAMLEASFAALNAEYGISLKAPEVPDLESFVAHLSTVEFNHRQYLGVGKMLKLSQPAFVERLMAALSAQTRSVYELARAEVEQWSRSATTQLETQWEERLRNFTRRMDAMDRIAQAADGLQDRIADIQKQSLVFQELDMKLTELTACFLNSPLASAPAQTRPMELA